MCVRGRRVRAEVLAFEHEMVKNLGMGPRFRPVLRDQLYLLPEDVREWVPSGHPSLFVAELVEELDLSEFYGDYTGTAGRGRPAYHPVAMVGILLYASMTAEDSSRRIEKLCQTDAGFRVVGANERPDHSTICRFLNRHRDALAGLFDQVVHLAAVAGLVDPTLVAVDGTKMAANASRSKNQPLGDLRERFNQWADDVEANDAAEQAAEAENPPPVPVPEMADPDQMREWIRQRLAERDPGPGDVAAGDEPADPAPGSAREGAGPDEPNRVWIQQRLADRAGEPDDRKMNTVDPDSALMPRSGGGWVQGYNAQAAAVEGGIVVAADVTANPADTTVLDLMISRIDQAIAAATGAHTGVVVADAGYWHTDLVADIDNDPARADLLVATGRRTPKEPPDPLVEPDPAVHAAALAAHQDLLDAEHDRRLAVIAKVAAGELLIREGAQALGLSVPRVGELKLAYETDGPNAVRPRHLKGHPRPRPLPPPTRSARARHTMDTRLASPAGRSLYRQRQAIIEPVFGDLKTNRRITRFWRRGIDKVRAEWTWMLTGHNLTLLYRHSP